MSDTILIKLGVSYEEGMSSDELYHATSVSWKISESKLRSGNYNYYCAVYNNKIKEIYEIIEYKKDNEPDKSGRIILKGKQVDEALREELLELDVSEIHTSSGNPIKYTSLNKLLDLAENKGEKIDEVNKDINHFWVTVNPKIWTVDKIKDGESFEYTSFNKNGSQRKVFKAFKKAKPGDKIVFYESTPRKEVVALGEVVKELHPIIEDGTENEAVKLKFVRDVNRISWSEMIELEELKDNSIIKSGAQGSLFELTKEEYEALLSLENTDKSKPNAVSELNHFYEVSMSPYNQDDFLREVFIDEKEYQTLTGLLTYKKNIILQGPPGVGKTFISKRLAYSLMGVKDENRVEIVQFHQNYAYEDFVMGYRPGKEGFRLETGVFYDFCKRAEKNPNEEYYFIIDEINRGNLTKIFGELFMLIERDSRGEHVTMGYSKEVFSVPGNINIIGTMNTADSSLSQIEIALRRRFAFYMLEPVFNEKWKTFMRENELSNEMVERISLAMEKINETIHSDLQLGRGYEIGHSFFTAIPHKNQDELSWYNTIIQFEIRPLLEEYFFDRPEEVNALLEEI